MYTLWNNSEMQDQALTFTPFPSHFILKKKAKKKTKQKQTNKQT